VSWRTNRLVVMARHVGRMFGINRWVAVWLNGGGYETRYDQGFSSRLQPGDCVWDVGANVGYYTRVFSEHIGNTGKVFAFEPSPTNFARLKSACLELRNVELRQFGLGHEDGRIAFIQGLDDLGATSRMTGTATGVLSGVADQTEVEIRSGDGLIQRGDAMAPNAIKIDVEGFELEVLQGLGQQLASSALHLIGVEVHFGILKERGMAGAPEQIEQLLEDNGYCVRWPDNSHILATRVAS
jgi:FkbM family methyltransferase